MKCAKCGAEIIPGAKFCGKCGWVVRESDPPRPSPERRKTSKGVNRMPQGIALGDGERIVKQYGIGRYTFRQGSIDVIVTNKRVIRYEESNWMGMQNNQIDEINIDAVHGTSTTMVRSISIIGAICALFFIIVGIAFISMNSGNSYRYYSSDLRGIIIGVIGICIGVFIFAKSCRPTLLFSLHGAIGGAALQTVVNNRGRLFGRNDTSVVFQFKPTSETTVMLKEIGACVYDLKTLGDAAIEKWS